MASLFPRLTCLLATVAAIGAPLGGCNFVSNSGPDRTSIVNGGTYHPAASGPPLNYALVPVTPDVASVLVADDVLAHFGPDLVRSAAAHVAIGAGDILNITIFEAAAGGLFIPADAGSRPGNFVTLPAQQVDSRGAINVPYAGAIEVAGQTPEEVQRTIERKLANRALEPQVVVAVQERRSGSVSVVGDVNTAAHYTLDPGGERLLAALARANGPKFPSYETVVSIQRNGVAEKALLSEISADPSQNVQVRPGDTVFVTHQPRFFLVFGATGNSTSLSTTNRRFPFGDTHLTLADALATAGGLDDTLANAEAVFLYRPVPKSMLTQMSVAVNPEQPDLVPTIFQVNLRSPGGFFVSSKFPVHSEDILYVSNAPAADLQKFLNLLSPFTGSAASAGSLR